MQKGLNPVSINAAMPVHRNLSSGTLSRACDNYLRCAIPGLVERFGDCSAHGPALRSREMAIEGYCHSGHRNPERDSAITTN